MEDIVQFDFPTDSPKIIKVIGVGGGGGNAVNHMYREGIHDVTFVLCNTDNQALKDSPVPVKLQLGKEGLGAGNRPARARKAAEESIEDIKNMLNDGTKMVFITAGMGGGTGTGAAPVIAKAAKELGILTVAIVTLPFKTEGPKRMKHAYEGIDELRQYVDSLLLINNENIQDIYGKLTLSEAFGKADDILATAAKSIAEVITRDNTVNVDFADVQTVMKDSGIALMGSGRASGDDRAMKVADAALASPLLNHNDIIGARNILINITSGEEEITLEETYLITEYIQTRSGNNADIIWGAGTDETLGQDIEVTIIATGFDIDTLPQSFDRMTSSPLQARIDSSVLQEDVPAGDEVPAEEETPAAEMPRRHGPFAPRPRWTPPTENSAVPQGMNPLQDRPGFNRPVQSGVQKPGAGESQAGVPGQNPFGMPGGQNANAAGGSNPLSRPAAAPQVIEAKRPDSDVNIDELENVPAFVRRNMKFVKDSSDEGGRATRVVLKDDAPQNDNPGGGSLFD